MFTKLDIKKFGLYNDFKWNHSVGAGYDEIFKKLNIIYGRNYTGKTTLSRLFKCIEEKTIHLDYPDSCFSMFVEDGSEIKEDNLESVDSSIKVRVYNSDFVNDNLSWLYKDDGTIEPFTILGSVNVSLEKKIKEIENKLGNLESNKGLIFDFETLSKSTEDSKKSLGKKQERIDKLLHDKAKSIKNDSTVFDYPTYIITTIKQDIGKCSDKDILNENEIDVKKKLLREVAKSEIKSIAKIDLNLNELLESTNAIISKKITPNKPITDLINNKLLQEWVRQGIDFHKGKREKCGFCGNILKDDLWEILGAHFNKESEELRVEIKNQKEMLNEIKDDFGKITFPSKENFYIANLTRIEELLKKWGSIETEFVANIQILISKLENREKDIFSELENLNLPDNSIKITEFIDEFNEVIKDNNKRAETIEKDQKIARKDLRLSEVAKFTKEIKYQSEIKEIQNLIDEKNKKESQLSTLKNEIDQLIENKRQLVAESKDESKGAELVNNHLCKYFGHDELKLEAFGSTPNIKFKIIRDGKEAKNLSGGECSLISFCYFIAKIEDELNSEKLIIFIDDPISSLDCNHIFFMFSLIDAVIVKPQKYGQLFISTHNLDFLKYLKHLSIPHSEKNNINHFLIERLQKQNQRKSIITLMPCHIRDYVTEFNYLFKEIYEVYKEVSGDRKMRISNTFNQFYNLPNNIRKFLECYLFYKYPNNDHPLKNLDKLFENNIPSLINRVVNEYSHLIYLERGWAPIDVQEAEECAKLIIEKIKEKDLPQFEALVESIT